MQLVYNKVYNKDSSYKMINQEMEEGQVPLCLHASGSATAWYNQSRSGTARKAQLTFMRHYSFNSIP